MKWVSSWCKASVSWVSGRSCSSVKWASHWYDLCNQAGVRWMIGFGRVGLFLEWAEMWGWCDVGARLVWLGCQSSMAWVSGLCQMSASLMWIGFWVSLVWAEGWASVSRVPAGWLRLLHHTVKASLLVDAVYWGHTKEITKRKHLFSNAFLYRRWETYEKRFKRFFLECIIYIVLLYFILIIHVCSINK